MPEGKVLFFCEGGGGRCCWSLGGTAGAAEDEAVRAVRRKWCYRSTARARDRNGADCLPPEFQVIYQFILPTLFA